MNHGSFTNREEVDAVKQPLLINASDNDQLLSRERLAQYQGALDCKKSVPSDVKVRNNLLSLAEASNFRQRWLISIAGMYPTATHTDSCRCEDSRILW